MQTQKYSYEQTAYRKEKSSYSADFELVANALANIGSLSDLFGNQDAKAIADFFGGDKEFLQWQKKSRRS